MTSNHVLGIKVVLPDGEIVELGSDSLESVGQDLTGMFIGSEGLFGVALEVTLRLLPKPEKYYTLQAAYDSLEKAGNAVAMVVASGLLPGAMEIMDRLSMDAADAAIGAGYPADAAAILIVELEGTTDEVEAEMPLLHSVMEESDAYIVEAAKDDAHRAKIWTGRKSAFSAVGRLSPDFIVQDGVVPRTKLAEALAEIERLSKKYGIRVANVFHVRRSRRGSVAQSRRTFRRDHSIMHSARRVDHRRAWRRSGKANVPRRNVRRGRHRIHAPITTGRRSTDTCESRQETSGRNSSCLTESRCPPT